MIESGSCFTEDCENVAHQNTKQASKQRVKAVDAEMARDVLPKLESWVASNFDCLLAHYLGEAK